jgi:tetratricopeptide (TPR) repeat protein
VPAGCSSSRRGRAGVPFACASLLSGLIAGSSAFGGQPYAPPRDDAVLTELPAGARHAAVPGSVVGANRLDVAVPLAQFDIAQSRSSGDLRFLGYADAVLAPWLARSPVEPRVMVLEATILQSRHAFAAALAELDRALAIDPRDAQAWLTRATVLGVLGRFDEAQAACAELSVRAGPSVDRLCTESMRSLSGHLHDAYAAVVSLSPQQLQPEVYAWRDSALGEMAQRIGDTAAAEHWFREGLVASPSDLYLRAAYADLLLEANRPDDVLTLLKGYEAMEPMLLRMELAHRMLGDGEDAGSEAALATAFELEAQRGDSVHLREQARFLLDVKHDAKSALAAAKQNFNSQREPADVLILLRAARAAGEPAAAASALEFLARTHLEDARLARYHATSDDLT